MDKDMKEILVELKVTNLIDKVSASQNIAGGIPQLNTKTQSFKLDGINGEEIIKKLIINILTCYCAALDYNNLDKSLPENWNKIKEWIK